VLFFQISAILIIETAQPTRWEITRQRALAEFSQTESMTEHSQVFSLGLRRTRLIAAYEP
jgi:hypothetical protein